MWQTVLQSASGITKCDRSYYKVRQVLQSVKIMIKWDVTEDSEGKSYSVCFFTTKREINCCKFTWCIRVTNRKRTLPENLVFYFDKRKNGNRGLKYVTFDFNRVQLPEHWNYIYIRFDGYTWINTSCKTLNNRSIVRGQPI